MGPGYVESVYEQALAVELDYLKLPFERQRVFNLTYREQVVGQGRLDFLVDDLLVVELKAVDALHPIHVSQVVSYLRALDCYLGLLINFNVSVLKQGIRRVIVD